MSMLDWNCASWFSSSCVLSAYVSIIVPLLCACCLMRACVYSQVLRTRLQAPALMMTTAGIWTRIKSGSKSSSFCHREDTMAPGSNSTPCSPRYTSPLPVSDPLYGRDLFIYSIKITIKTLKSKKSVFCHPYVNVLLSSCLYTHQKAIRNNSKIYYFVSMLRNYVKTPLVYWNIVLKSFFCYISW